MSRNRVYLVVVALLALMAGLGGVIGNIASARLPKSLDPYLWLAWPLFMLLTLSTVGLVLWQIRLERESSSEKEFDKPPHWLPQLTDAVKAVMQPTGTPARPPVVHSTSQDGADEDSDFSGDYTYDVFVSHSQVDEAWVREELLMHLERAGLKTCLTDRDLEPGTPLVSEIQRALENSRKTVLVLSRAYLGSEWARYESYLLQTLDPTNQERRLIPLLKEACDLPVRLAYLVPIDFSQPEDQEAAWTRLLSAIGTVQPKQSRSDLLIHPVVPNNLPPRGHFVGRQAEKGLIQQALRSRVHLASVEGPGGVGKTTLVLEAAHDCLTSIQNPVRASSWPRFAGFVWATAAGRELTLEGLLDTIAQTLDCPDILKEPPEQKRESVRKLLQRASCLIIVDNFETVMDAEVRSFLANIPEPSRVLVTTRERDLTDAVVVSVTSLPEPDALELMRTTGQSIGLTSVANASNDTLLRLYRVTGGLPLAIKWAIGQIKQEGQALETVLAALQEAKGDVFDRVFTRSWSLLTAEARRVLLIMPMFVAPTLQAAIEAASGLHGSVLSEALGQLVRMSLIEATDELDSVRRRYTVHPLTRAFAVSKLQETPALEYEAREGLAEYYGEFTQSNGSFGNWEGFARLDADFPNISAAVNWCWGQQLTDLGIQISSHLSPYLVNRGYWNDAIDLIGTAAEKAVAIGDQLTAARLWVHPLAWLYRQRGDLDRATSYVQKALRVFEELDEKQDTADAKRNLGRIAQRRGDLDEADRLLTDALALFREVGRDSLAIITIADLATARIERGDLDAAETLCKDALPEARRLNDTDAIGFLLRVRGKVSYLRGDFGQAQVYVAEALSCPSGLNGLSYGKLDMAKIQLARGDPRGATDSLQYALEGFKKMGTRAMVKECEELLAELRAPDSQESHV